MKKIIATLLAVAMMAALIAGCGSKSADNNTSAAAESQAASAMEIYETIQASFTGEMFSAAGGDMDNMSMDGAGVYDIEKNADAFMSTVLMPQDQMADIKNDVATLQHMMNVNSFCSAVMKLNDGVDVKAFAEAYKTAVQSNQWMCGFPDKVLVYYVDGYVLTIYAMEDCLTDYQNAINAAYPNAELLVDAPAEG